MQRIENLPLVSLPPGGEEFEGVLRAHVKDRLKRNRLVWQIIEKLEGDLSLALNDVAKNVGDGLPLRVGGSSHLADLCPSRR